MMEIYLICIFCRRSSRPQRSERTIWVQDVSSCLPFHLVPRLFIIPSCLLFLLPIYKANPVILHDSNRKKLEAKAESSPALSCGGGGGWGAERRNTNF